MGKLYDAVKNKNVGGKELSSVASEFVNSFVKNYSELDLILANEETKKEFQDMSIAFVKCLAKMNKEIYLHDGRNEYACKIATKLLQYDGMENYISYGDGVIPYETHVMSNHWEERYASLGRARVFALFMSNEHRTLQQSFAEFAFICIQRMLEEGGDTGLSEYMGCDSWCRMPMI